MKIVGGCFPIGVELPTDKLPFNRNSKSFKTQSSIISDCKKLGCINGFECTPSGNCVIKAVTMKSFVNNFDNSLNPFSDILAPMNGKSKKVIIRLPDDIKKNDIIEGRNKVNENSIHGVVIHSTTYETTKSNNENLISRNYRPSTRLTADFIFKQCCVDRNIPDACRRKCSYKDYTKEAIMQMYLGRDDCPISYARELHFCAAQGTDHSECCRRKGVASTAAGDKCLIFCDQRPGSVAMLDTSHLHCYIQFENIKSCFSEKN
uniref:DB domain-containing protein n=1 Tax=Parastrongyloides trichosuri TaxID=131310 RepID=A0A0N4ZCJ8_PARTI